MQLLTILSSFALRESAGAVRREQLHLQSWWWWHYPAGLGASSTASGGAQGEQRWEPPCALENWRADLQSSAPTCPLLLLGKQSVQGGLQPKQDLAWNAGHLLEVSVTWGPAAGCAWCRGCSLPSGSEESTELSLENIYCISL